MTAGAVGGVRGRGLESRRRSGTSPSLSCLPQKRTRHRAAVGPRGLITNHPLSFVLRFMSFACFLKEPIFWCRVSRLLDKFTFPVDVVDEF